jgi:hypothetical protein
MFFVQDATIVPLELSLPRKIFSFFRVSPILAVQLPAKKYFPQRPPSFFKTYLIDAN